MKRQGIHRARAARTKRSGRRRATVIVQVVSCFTLLCGFASLTIDAGAMYNAKAEIQRCADAEALAAAAERGDSSGDPLARARTVARQYASLNTVLRDSVQLDDSDFTFGSAQINESTGQYVFTTTNTNPNAVRGRVRHTAGSPCEPMNLYFGQVFVNDTANIWAHATTVLSPLDIASVMDLSASHNDESSLVHYRLTNISNRDVWAQLWDSALVNQPTSGGLPSGRWS